MNVFTLKSWNTSFKPLLFQGSLRFFTTSKSDRKSVRQRNSGKINLLKNCLSTNVAIQTCVEWEIFQMNYSRILLIPVQKMKWCTNQNSFNTSHSTHVSLIRRQTSNKWWLLLRLQFPLVYNQVFSVCEVGPCTVGLVLSGSRSKQQNIPLNILEPVVIYMNVNIFAGTLIRQIFGQMVYWIYECLGSGICLPLGLAVF